MLKMCAFSNHNKRIKLSTTEIKLPRCHLTLPAYLTIRCSKLNEPTIQKETIYLTELPNTVLDLKHAISVKLDIPIICMLELSVESMRLYDEQSIEEDIPLRDSDELHLVYLYRCQPGQVSALMKSMAVISSFADKYIIQPNFKDNDIKYLISRNDKIFEVLHNDLTNTNYKIPTKSIVGLTYALNCVANFVSSWDNDSVSSCRLYLAYETIIHKIKLIWNWSLISTTDYLVDICMSIYWNFQEKLIDRLFLVQTGCFELAMDMLLCDLPYNCTEHTKRASYGVLWGFSEFPLGQRIIGSNERFINNIAKTFNSQQITIPFKIITSIMFSVASHYSNHKIMKKYNLLECTVFSPEHNSQSSQLYLNSTLHYNCCIFTMYLIKSPDYPISDSNILNKVFKYLIRFQQKSSDTLIADSEISRGTTWGSMVPFLELFFIPNNSPLYQFESLLECNWLDAYYGVARISLSAVLYQRKNRELCLDENLYGYLIILYWRQAKHPDNKRLLHGILNRFNPIPYRIPSLLQIATAQHAFNNQGLLAALDIL